MSGAHTGLRASALAEVLAQRRREEQQRLYIAQMAWRISTQLHALSGGDGDPVPDALTLFMPPAATHDRRSAEDIRRELIDRFRRGQGKEQHHGTTL